MEENELMLMLTVARLNFNWIFSLRGWGHTRRGGLLRQMFHYQTKYFTPKALRIAWAGQGVWQTVQQCALR